MYDLPLYICNILYSIYTHSNHSYYTHSLMYILCPYTPIMLTHIQSQMLRAAAQASARSIFVTGHSCTTAGLTASLGVLPSCHYPRYITCIRAWYIWGCALCLLYIPCNMNTHGYLCVYYAY